MNEALDKRALQYACKRVEEFSLVHVGRSASEKTDAVDIWLESLGLDEASRAEFGHWMTRFVGPEADTGSILLGLIVGLLILQWNHDHPAT